MKLCEGNEYRSRHEYYTQCFAIMINSNYAAILYVEIYIVSNYTLGTYILAVYKKSKYAYVVCVYHHNYMSSVVLFPHTHDYFCLHIKKAYSHASSFSFNKIID